mmetsp:Transcript_9288/g.22382  ORF Transcript_9288/g.22382 Transcript_9288/m.22382 type:complete len:120 (-) Transcript_9288:161-520(-)
MGSNVSLCEEEPQPEQNEGASPLEEAVHAVEEAVEEVVEEVTKPSVEVKSIPPDMRFPTQNQARHCFTRYNEYHKCIKEKGEEAEDCKFYQKAYRTLCPDEWIAKWNEERENGTFPGKY